MVVSRDMSIRRTAVAGRFYPDSPRQCELDVEKYTQRRTPPMASIVPGHCVAGIVPHAGWICSGFIAGLVWRILADQMDRSQPCTVFLTGSVHTVHLVHPALDTFDAWATPLGPIEVDQELRDAIGKLDNFEPFTPAHVNEHALEVQLPMIRHCFGETVRIVPCMIPPHPRAAQWGRALGKLIAVWPHPVLCIASSDLTHYGPDFGFTPAGFGETGRRWAHEVNDQRLLDLVAALKFDAIVQEAEEHLNACGGGAIAAVLAAAQYLGAASASVLEHTDSTTVLSPLGYADKNNSVGYAGVVM